MAAALDTDTRYSLTFIAGFRCQRNFRVLSFSVMSGLSVSVAVSPPPPSCLFAAETFCYLWKEER